MLDALTSWLGSGGQPVKSELAEYRAFICSECPLNVELKWWEKMLKNPIAAAMRETLEMKHKMNLTTTLDHKLGVCKNCGCCNPLHVWTPLEHILSHTSPDMLGRFDINCWIINEQK